MGQLLAFEVNITKSKCKTLFQLFEFKKETPVLSCLMLLCQSVQTSVLKLKPTMMKKRSNSYTTDSKLLLQFFSFSYRKYQNKPELAETSNLGRFNNIIWYSLDTETGDHIYIDVIVPNLCWCVSTFSWVKLLTLSAEVVCRIWSVGGAAI